VDHPTSSGAHLSFHGGLAGALAPFVLFLVGVGWLGLSGAPDETGFWPVLLGALTLGLLLARDKRGYAEAMLDGMSRKLVMLMVMAWMLASVFGVLLRDSGLVQSLVWAAQSAGVGSGGYAVAAFLVSALFSTATGTSLGRILVCAPLLYPAGGVLGTDPAFLIGAILAGATFGDNVSPVSDTTIASASTQGADISGVVRSRMRYALPAAFVSIAVFAALGGGDGTQAGGGPPVDADATGLLMLAIPVMVLIVLMKQRHLIEGLVYGILGAAILGFLLGRFTPTDLFSIDRENFVAQGLVLDGMRRAVGVSVFTILLMGLVGGLEAAGIVHRIVAWVRSRSGTPGQAEWWIFGSVTGATVLTTHSTVAILTIGDLAKEVGEGAGIDAYRRANILDVTVCTYPFLFPVFIPVILAASMTAGVDGMPRVSPWEVGLHNVHSWALLVIIVLAITTGWGRTVED